VAEVSPQQPHLRLLNGPQVGTCVPLDFLTLKNRAFVLGRIPEVDLILYDPANRVSRRHAEISWRNEDELLVLRDTSSNGTYLNGQLIASVMPLFPGDNISCGSLELLFYVPIEDLRTLLAQLPDEKHYPEDSWPGVARLDVLETDARNLKRGSFCRITPQHPFTIGRFSDNDLQLLDEDVSRNHAEIRWFNNSYVLRDLGAANPTYINDEPVSAPRRLVDGDIINIRGSEFRYRAPRAAYREAKTRETQSSGNQRLRFAVDDRELQLGPTCIALPHDRQVQIGRTDTNDLRLLDPFVSKRHATLFYESGHFVLSDLGTANGVIVNGQDIRRPIALRNGDRIKIGHFEFVYEDYDPARETDGKTALLRSGQPISLQLSENGRQSTSTMEMVRLDQETKSRNYHPLRTIPPFDELDQGLFDQIVPLFKQITYIAGQEIAREGSGRGAFFAVTSGHITISRALNERREERLVLAEIGPGNIYGERTVFANQPFVNRLVARTRVETFRLDETDFIQKLSGNEKIVSFFQQQVANFSTTTWLRGTILLRTFSDKTIRELASRMRFRTYKPGEIMVERDKPADQFFLIVGGKAVAFTINSKEQEQIVADLEEGDNFGDGIASEGETYPVSVRAQTGVDAYVLNKADFELVLSQSADPLANLGAELLGLPLVAVLNRISPFNSMPPQLVAQIASRMKIKNFKKGRTIFKQGSRAEAFYIIRKGQVDISFQTSSGETRTDMTIGPGQFFGEAALSSDQMHTNTSTASEDCQLLTLYRNNFEEVLKLGGNLSLGQFLAKGISKRYRPRRIADWTITEQVNALGEQAYLLCKEEQDFFKLSEGGYFLWNLMDGDNSINDLVVHYLMQFQSFDPEGVANLVTQLQGAGFLETPKVDERLIKSESGKQGSAFSKAMNKLLRILTFSTELKNVDGFFTGLYKYFGKIFFFKPVQILMGLVIVAGLAAFVIKGGLIALVNPPLALFVSGLWWILILVLLFNFLIHELAHGIACKHFGRKVMGVGLGWYLVGPVFHVDTHQIWLERRWPRIVVNLAGPLTNILFCNICFLLLLFVPEADTQTRDALFQLGVIAFTLAYINLNPLVEGDGYYALMDWVEIPSLRRKALVHVRRWLSRKPDVRTYSDREKIIFKWFVALIPVYLVIIMGQFVFWLGGIAIALLQNLNMEKNTAFLLGVSVAVVITLLMAIPMFVDLFTSSQVATDEEDETTKRPSVRSGRSRGGK
jgi:putative peptide zinc metalloprotease protein